MIIGNPGDRAVYFYKEGMAAPMGQFLTPGRSPRAVLALDRSLKERSTRGLYQNFASLPAPGDYDLVFFMDSPRFLHFFALTVPGSGDRVAAERFRFLPPEPAGPLQAGRPARLRFRLAADGRPPYSGHAGVPVQALVSVNSGGQTAVELSGKPAVYAHARRPRRE